MTRPHRARSMPFEARLTTRNVPPRFVATTLSKSSSVMRSSSVSLVMPAFATTISTGPSCALDLGERGIDGCGIRHVCAHGERALGSLAGARGDGDLVAVGDEALGDGAADAAVASGDEDDAIGGHGALPEGWTQMDRTSLAVPCLTPPARTGTL